MRLHYKASSTFTIDIQLSSAIQEHSAQGPQGSVEPSLAEGSGLTGTGWSQTPHRGVTGLGKQPDGSRHRGGACRELTLQGTDFLHCGPFSFHLPFLYQDRSHVRQHSTGEPYRGTQFGSTRPRVQPVPRAAAPAPDSEGAGPPEGHSPTPPSRCCSPQPSPPHFLSQWAGLSQMCHGNGVNHWDPRHLVPLQKHMLFSVA